MASYYNFRYNKRPNNSPYWMSEEYEARITGRELSKSDKMYVDDDYVDTMETILSAPPCIGVPPEPTQIYPNVFLGTQANADNLDLLKRMRITHVLYCAGLPLGLKASRSAKYRGTGIQYEELAIDDSETTEIRPFFRRAHGFIDHARVVGKVLISDSGVSRAGAVAISYLVRTGTRLLEAVQTIKSLRRVVLTNSGFMKQIVAYARELRLLDPDLSRVRAPKYGRTIDRARIFSAHLPVDFYY